MHMYAAAGGVCGRACAGGRTRHHHAHCVTWGYMHAAQQTDKAKALFQVYVAFESHGMAFTPNEAAILNEINANTLDGIVSVAQVRWHEPQTFLQKHMHAGVLKTVCAFLNIHHTPWMHGHAGQKLP